MRLAQSYPLIPNPCDNEHDELRFFHRDLPRLDHDQAWGEQELLRAHLAALAFSRDDGRILVVVSGQPVFESTWVRDRLKKLAAHLRGRAA